MESGDALDRLAALEAAMAGVAELRVEALSNPERVELLQRLEAVVRRVPAVGHTVIAALVRDVGPEDFGGQRIKNVLADSLRITPADAGRRIHEAEALAPRTAFTGEPLEPVYAHTAAAQRDGIMGREHVTVVREFFDHLPRAVDTPTREAAEKQLTDFAAQMRPDELRKVADRLAACLHPDGDFDERDRARIRTLQLGRQGRDKMSRLTGWIDPELRAYLEPILAKLAKPGMCDPDADTPVVDGDPDPDAQHRDRRSHGQRCHDALKTVCRAMLASGDLGHHRGLPVTVIASTTVQELEAKAGTVITGGGSLLPMPDLIRMAAHATHYLAIFDHHDNRPLYLGRTKRIASPDQRIVLHAKDRGCTFPSCDAPGYLCEAHHINDYAAGGATDADTLTFLCPPHHSLIGDHTWRTTKNGVGRTRFTPPHHIDPRQHPRTNLFHHPLERLQAEDDP